MHSETDQSDESRQQENPSESRTVEQKKLDRLANEAAEKLKGQNSVSTGTMTSLQNNGHPKGRQLGLNQGVSECSQISGCRNCTRPIKSSAGLVVSTLRNAPKC